MKRDKFKYIFGVVVVALATSLTQPNAVAQISKQVEVTKAYIPEIAPAQRLSHTPDMSDTVRLRPEISYSVVPQSIESRLAQSIYQPTDIEYVEVRKREDFYIKAGIGLPFQTEGDLYFSKPVNESSYLLGYINHNGQYADIEDISASRSHNKFGVAYASELSQNREFGMNLSYNLNTWSRYATPSAQSADPRYNTLALSATYGDKFVQWSQWNWGVDLSVDRFWNNSDVNSTELDFVTHVGREVGSGRFVASLDFETIGGGGDSAYDNYGNNTLTVGAKYVIRLFNNVKSTFGLAYGYDRIKMGSESETHGYLLPSLSMKHEIGRAISPFFEVESDIMRNDYASLVEVNPYIINGGFASANTVDYNMRIGVEGIVAANRLSYRLSANYEISDNALYWALVEQAYAIDADKMGVDNYYAVTSATRKSLSLDLESEYRASRNFGFTVDMSLSKYFDSEQVTWSNSLPAFEMGIGAKYTAGAITFNLSADLEGVAYTTLISQSDTLGEVAQSVQTPTTVNLGLGIDWRVRDTLAIYLRGDNLANADLYRWMGYKEYGIGVIAGVKVEF